jgi:tetratricopeptide (TPR) repeat protein
MDAYRLARAADPGNAQIPVDIGHVLVEQGKLNDAIVSYRQAITLDPRNATAYVDLGSVRGLEKQWDQAITAYRQAIAIEPDMALAHNQLGQALAEEGRWAEAIAAYRQAIVLNPQSVGQLESLVTTIKRQAGVENKLAALVKGEYQPRSTNERMWLAEVARTRGLNDTAARLYQEAFADPQVAPRIEAGQRYQAACSAALAAAGKGEDVVRLTDKERSRWRTQALDWMHVNLSNLSQRLKSGKPQVRALVRRRLGHWQQDPDLAGLRDPDVLAKLPDSDREACQKFWAQVEAMLQRAQRPGR